MSDMVSALKAIALNAVAASKPVELVTGTVTSANPLEIQVSQKLFLQKNNLILPEWMSDMPFEAEGDIDIHDSRRAVITNGILHGAPRTGDALALLRIQGGQKYFVVGRLAK